MTGNKAALGLNLLAHATQRGAVQRTIDTRGRLRRGVKVKVAPELPRVVVDRSRLTEVFQNLIENGVKFMGEQSHPQIDAGAQTNDGGAICYVRDNGIGVEPHQKTGCSGCSADWIPRWRVPE